MEPPQSIKVVFPPFHFCDCPTVDALQTESSRYSSTTQTTVSPRKRTAETQTLKKRKRAKKLSAAASAAAAEAAVSAATAEVMVDVDFDLGVIAKDRPLWTASSTQTRQVIKFNLSYSVIIYCTLVTCSVERGTIQPSSLVQQQLIENIHEIYYSTLIPNQ